MLSIKMTTKNKKEKNLKSRIPVIKISLCRAIRTWNWSPLKIKVSLLLKNLENKKSNLL